MKILGTNKKGTKMLIDKNEAVIVFTKKGVEFSAPKPFLFADSEDEAFDYARDNNPNLSHFLKIMNSLEDSIK